MSFPEEIRIQDYYYELPPNRIAEYPAAVRDASRLLVRKEGKIFDSVFSELHTHLPEGGLMVFNNTRVIRARLVFHKETGARIEVFCLEPVVPTAEINQAFDAPSPVTWKCLIGNARKWKSGRLELLLGREYGSLYAERAGEIDGAFLVKLSWDSNKYSLAEILEAAGKTPLPPYIERDVEKADSKRYQTIYAKHDGSVAAPTAGLHFTNNVMQSLAKKSIKTANVTLHVSAGTFKPVDHDDIRDHEMHSEQLIVHRSLIKDILDNESKLTAVGTTSTRTLESLYWYGVLLENDPEAKFNIDQWLPYTGKRGISANKAFQNILDMMDDKGIEEISGHTSLIIVPGYEYRIVDILITNFHMPKSTLLLLVSAFIGDEWRDVYDYALANDFRFLSYGDSCLFFREETI